MITRSTYSSPEQQPPKNQPTEDQPFLELWQWNITELENLVVSRPKICETYLGEKERRQWQAMGKKRKLEYLGGRIMVKRLWGLGKDEDGQRDLPIFFSSNQVGKDAFNTTLPKTLSKALSKKSELEKLEIKSYYSITHSKTQLVVGLSRHPIGIDLEVVDDALFIGGEVSTFDRAGREKLECRWDRVVQRFFEPEEARIWLEMKEDDRSNDRIEFFYRHWTEKEARYKLLSLLDFLKRASDPNSNSDNASVNFFRVLKGEGTEKNQKNLESFFLVNRKLEDGALENSLSSKNSQNRGYLHVYLQKKVDQDNGMGETQSGPQKDRQSTFSSTFSDLKTRGEGISGWRTSSSRPIRVMRFKFDQ